MTYQQEAELARDADFAARVGACLCEEAQTKGDDDLADLILRDPSGGVRWFMPFLSTAPGFGDAYGAGGQAAIDDGMILSGVQACWADVGDLAGYQPPSP